MIAVRGVKTTTMEGRLGCSTWQESIAQGLPIARQDSENISASDNFSDHVHFQLQIPQLFIAQPPGCRLCHGHDLLPLHLSTTCNVYLYCAALLSCMWFYAS